MRVTKQKVFEFIFDFMTACVSFFDIATDLIVTIQFYNRGDYVFFWISITILLISQTLYSVFFTWIYVRRESHLKDIFYFILVFPVAQFVPFFIFLDSFNWKITKSLINVLKLDPNALEFTPSPGVDPIRNLIKKKLYQHGGFLIETVAESVPESILQMTAMVVRQEISYISVVSILLSISSVASKAYMISYCVDRFTFAFNFLCYVYDVFSLFCTVSWLFATEGGDQSLSDVFNHLPLLCFIWFVRFGVTALSFSILALLAYIKELTTSMKIRGRILLFIGFWFIIGPFLIVVEAFKLSFFPIVIFKPIGDSKYSRNRQFYMEILDFLRQGSFEEKMFFTNKVLAATKVRRTNRKIDSTTWILESDDFIDLKATRKLNKLDLRSMIRKPPKKHSWETVARYRIGLVTYYYLWYFVPFVFLNAIFGFLFPFLRLITAYQQANLLQIWLTAMLGFIILLIAILSPKAYFWGMTVTHMVDYGIRLEDEILKDIRKHYAEKSHPELPLHLAGRRTRTYKLHNLKFKIKRKSDSVPSLVDLCCYKLYKDHPNLMPSLTPDLRDYLNELVDPDLPHPKDKVSHEALVIN